MPKKKLFDEDSEEDIDLKTENEYAKKYDTWREKEELHKLEQKYGDKPLGSDVSSDSDTESEELEVSEETETQFLKTLALLKTKDPRIYDPQYKAFEEKQEKDEVEKPKPKTLTFEDSDDDEEGPIFTIEKKAQVDDQPTLKEKEQSTSKKSKPKVAQYLAGETEEEVDKDLAPLRALWSDPNLNEGEAFLRDYILNQRYLDGSGSGLTEDRLRDDVELEEDEKRVEEQGQFERAYNFRFEEPDQEFLKRFPRTVNSLRPKDDRRAKKRAELRTRKADDKQRKMDEIGRLKALKLKEIQEKIAKIKEVTGNEDLAFKDEDIEGDFDPAEHDRRMQAIFDEQYYQDADGEKPVFPDLDEELEIENWADYDPESDRQEAKQADGPHCEDEEFNMDADYDPKQRRTTLMEEIQKTLGNKRRNRKKKSKLAQLLSTEKPKFVPNQDKTYEEYMEEYYKMDCEDIIGGDLPTRFRYREVVPNDYGLSVEEILLADDRELTQWVPLKKIVRHRPAAVQKGEVNVYRQKAADPALKRKVLPSLFKDLPEEPELVIPVEGATKKKKKKKKKKKNKDREENASKPVENESVENESEPVKNNHSEEIVDEQLQTNEPRVVDSDDTPKKKKKRKGNAKNDDALQDIQVIQQSKNKEDHNETSPKNNEVDSTGVLKKPKKAKSVQNISAEHNKTSEIDEKGGKKNKINHKVNETTSAKPAAENIDAIVGTSKKDKKKNKKSVVNNTNNLTSNDNEIANRQSKQHSLVNVNIGKSHKNKQKKEGFIVESVQSQAPSTSAFTKDLKINNLKRKSNTKIDQIPMKKSKPFDKKGKVFKNKFKHKDDKTKNDTDNPMSKLSDERLKAYGLNPKKYRSFLKYKKF